MTVTLQNVDVPFLEVLKSLVKLRKNVVIQEVNDDDKEVSSEEHIKQINAVYDKVDLKEQTFTCDASKAAVWEMIKNDTW